MSNKIDTTESGMMKLMFFMRPDVLPIVNRQ